MISIRIMLAGDTHGDIRNVAHKVEWAKKAGGIQRIIVLGDFGLWWGHEGVVFLDECNELAKKNNLQIFALPGNHENHEHWDAIVNNAQAKAHGWAYIRSNVLISPKVHDFVWGKKQFVVAGGAVSIDKEYRLEYERLKGKKVWSPNEQLTDTQVEEITKSRFGNGVKVDYLLTHDCSNRTPFGFRLKPDIDSQIHRQRIDKVLGAVKPKFHWHGHMHEKYDWLNRVGGELDDYTQTYGLECNSDRESWGILDIKTDEFVWASEIQQNL